MEDRFYSWFKIANLLHRPVESAVESSASWMSGFRQVARHRLRCARPDESMGQTQNNSRRSSMLTKLLRPAILIVLAIAPYGVGHAADMAIDCRLKGGTVVKLPAEACKVEGGAQVNEAASPSSITSPASGAVLEPVDGNVSGNQPTGISKLEATQKWIVDLLAKPVETTTPLNRNPEGIARTAKFEGCRLVVDEDLHIQYGNFFSVWKDFKINSVIDFQNIDRDEFGILGKISSKGGDLSAEAVYFEEPKRKGGNNISISVLNLRNGNYTKYTMHGPSAYWDAPRDDLWIADEYGYAKDNGLGNVVTDKIRILLMVSSSDDAARLKNAFEEVNTMCKPQHVETK
jgi:hypothetical protein